MHVEDVIADPVFANRTSLLAVTGSSATTGHVGSTGAGERGKNETVLFYSALFCSVLFSSRVPRRTHLANVGGNHVADELTGVGEDGAPLAHRRHDAREVVVREYHVGGMARHSRACVGESATAKLALNVCSARCHANGRMAPAYLRFTVMCFAGRSRRHSITGAAELESSSDTSRVKSCLTENQSIQYISNVHHSPLPIATPMSARTSAGASFTPSPVMATT